MDPLRWKQSSPTRLSVVAAGRRAAAFLNIPTMLLTPLDGFVCVNRFLVTEIIYNQPTHSVYLSFIGYFPSNRVYFLLKVQTDPGSSHRVGRSAIKAVHYLPAPELGTSGSENGT